MLEALLSLPTLVGCPLFSRLTIAVGLTVYYVTFRLYAKHQTAEAIKEIKEATSNLFRVVGWLFTLLLSLTFTDVVNEMMATETAVEGEAAAIEDMHRKLRRFGREEIRDIRQLLIDYTQAVIQDDWPALAQDRLSGQADELLLRLEDATVELGTTDAIQKTLQSRMIADLDTISDHRLSRLKQARERPSLVLNVVFFGYLVTMVLFGVYQPRLALMVLMALYTAFVGIAIYLILALGDPFQGGTVVDPRPLEYVLEILNKEGPA